MTATDFDAAKGRFFDLALSFQVLANVEGYFIAVNPALCRALDYDESALLNAPYLSFVHPDDYDATLNSIQNLIRTHELENFENRYRRRDGSYLWLQWSAQMTAEGMIYGNAIDVTQRKALEAERFVAGTLELELARQHDLNQMRERFASMVSHEFRTPLAIVLSSVESVQRYYDRFTRERVMEKMDTVAMQVHRMISIMEDMLVFSRLSTGNQPETRFDLVMLCETIINDLRLTDAKQHPITFQTAFSELYVTCNRRLVEHIVINLITNAMKYSLSTRRIDISLFLDGNTVVFTCADQGIGIPPDALSQLFEPFQRAQNVGAIQGTGLGLAIVKQCVTQLGGTIYVESQVGSGTCFTVQLPLI